MRWLLDGANLIPSVRAYSARIWRNAAVLLCFKPCDQCVTVAGHHETALLWRYGTLCAILA
jgi:hypothetical protein